MPKRIQRRRTKGWRIPEGAIYVGRGSKWGNPFKIGDQSGVFDPPASLTGEREILVAEITPEIAVNMFRGMMTCLTPEMHPNGHEWRRKFGIELRRHIQRELGGHDLACWCPLDQPCHADVLLEVANSE